MIQKVTYDGENHVTTIHISHTANKEWSQKFLLSSDRHWDNPKSDRELQLKHLRQAKKENAGIIDCGDLFCAMQGKYDPRGNKSSIRPEHNKVNYFDALVETASEFFKPYAKNFVLIGQGNHETSVLNRHETDLTERLIANLREENPEISSGSYSGFIRFKFEHKSGNGGRKSVKLFYHHGYGGDSPVTKGTIQTSRMGIMYPDANIIISGHTHNSWVFPISRYRLDDNGSTYIDEQVHVKLPTYKEEFNKGKSDFHVISGRGPKPVGAYWLNFYYEDGTIKYNIIHAS